MAGATIDHIIAIITFLAAFFIFVGLISQTIQSAIIYQQHRYLAVKCSDLLDRILLNPGYPLGWGEGNLTPTSFGLQSPNLGGYQLSPFSVLRLLPQEDRIYYNRTGEWYVNYSLGVGGDLLMPVSSCVNYSLVSRLLGVNGTYGFQLTITPLLQVSVTETNANPLTVEVSVSGPGLPVNGANVTSYLLYVYKPDDSDYPYFNSTSETAITGSDGKTSIVFDGVDGSKNAYTVIVYASVGGLFGVGYVSRKTTTNENLIPFIENYEERKIIIAHSWDVHYYGPPVPNIFYNASFFVLTEDFALRRIEIPNATGAVNYGEGKPYTTTVIPTFDPGLLVITYRTGNKFGVVMMPWGISSLGVSLTFGEEPFGRDWVTTDIRQVAINKLPYQVKLALWSLRGYQVTG